MPAYPASLALRGVRWEAYDRATFRTHVVRRIPSRAPVTRRALAFEEPRVPTRGLIVLI